MYVVERKYRVHARHHLEATVEKSATPTPTSPSGARLTSDADFRADMADGPHSLTSRLRQVQHLMVCAYPALKIRFGCRLRIVGGPAAGSQIEDGTRANNSYERGRLG